MSSINSSHENNANQVVHKPDQNEKDTPHYMMTPIPLADEATGEFEEVESVRKGLHQRHIQSVHLVSRRASWSEDSSADIAKDDCIGWDHRHGSLSELWSSN